MTKKIVVKSCNLCPIKKPVLHNHCVVFVCSHSDTFGLKIEDLDNIPDWCELEDNNVSKN